MTITSGHLPSQTDLESYTDQQWSDWLQDQPDSVQDAFDLWRMEMVSVFPETSGLVPTVDEFVSVLSGVENLDSLPGYQDFQSLYGSESFQSQGSSGLQGEADYFTDQMSGCEDTPEVPASLEAYDGMEDLDVDSETGYGDFLESDTQKFEGYDPFEYQLMDQDLEWILQDSHLFLEFVETFGLQKAFLNTDGSFKFIPSGAASFYAVLQRQYPDDFLYALQSDPTVTLFSSVESTDDFYALESSWATVDPEFRSLLDEVIGPYYALPAHAKLALYQVYSRKMAMPVEQMQERVSDVLDDLYILEQVYFMTGDEQFSTGELFNRYLFSLVNGNEDLSQSIEGYQILSMQMKAFEVLTEKSLETQSLVGEQQAELDRLVGERDAEVDQTPSWMWQFATVAGFMYYNSQIQEIDANLTEISTQYADVEGLRDQGYRSLDEIKPALRDLTQSIGLKQYRLLQQPGLETELEHFLIQLGDDPSAVHPAIAEEVAAARLAESYNRDSGSVEESLLQGDYDAAIERAVADVNTSAIDDHLWDLRVLYMASRYSEWSRHDQNLDLAMPLALEFPLPDYYLGLSEAERETFKSSHVSQEHRMVEILTPNPFSGARNQGAYPDRIEVRILRSMHYDDENGLQSTYDNYTIAYQDHTLLVENRDENGTILKAKSYRQDEIEDLFSSAAGMTVDQAISEAQGENIWGRVKAADIFDQYASQDAVAEVALSERQALYTAIEQHPDLQALEELSESLYLGLMPLQTSYRNALTNYNPEQFVIDMKSAATDLKMEFYSKRIEIMTHLQSAKRSLEALLGGMDRDYQLVVQRDEILAKMAKLEDIESWIGTATHPGRLEEFLDHIIGPEFHQSSGLEWFKRDGIIILGAVAGAVLSMGTLTLVSGAVIGATGTGALLTSTWGMVGMAAVTSGGSVMGMEVSKEVSRQAFGTEMESHIGQYLRSDRSEAEWSELITLLSSEFGMQFIMQLAVLGAGAGLSRAIPILKAAEDPVVRGTGYVLEKILQVMDDSFRSLIGKGDPFGKSLRALCQRMLGEMGEEVLQEAGETGLDKVHPSLGFLFAVMTCSRVDAQVNAHPFTQFADEQGNTTQIIHFDNKGSHSDTIFKQLQTRYQGVNTDVGHIEVRQESGGVTVVATDMATGQTHTVQYLATDIPIGLRQVLGDVSGVSHVDEYFSQTIGIKLAGHHLTSELHKDDLHFQLKSGFDPNRMVSELESAGFLIDGLEYESSAKAYVNVLLPNGLQMRVDMSGEQASELSSLQEAVPILSKSFLDAAGDIPGLSRPLTPEQIAEGVRQGDPEALEAYAMSQQQTEQTAEQSHSFIPSSGERVVQRPDGSEVERDLSGLGRGRDHPLGDPTHPSLPPVSDSSEESGGIRQGYQELETEGSVQDYQARHETFDIPENTVWVDPDSSEAERIRAQDALQAERRSEWEARRVSADSPLKGIAADHGVQAADAVVSSEIWYLPGEVASDAEVRAYRAAETTVSLMMGAEPLSRQQVFDAVKAEIQDATDASGTVLISSDTDKGIHSMIDMVNVARHFDIIDTEGGITQQKLTSLLARLYTAQADGVKIDATELGHVPIVVSATLDFYSLMKEGQATASEFLVMFVASAHHDSGKNYFGIRTVHGYRVAPGSFLLSPDLNLDRPIDVLPGESFLEALNRNEIDPALAPLFDHDEVSSKAFTIPAGLRGNETGQDIHVQAGQSFSQALEEAGFSYQQAEVNKSAKLLGVFLHHDSQAVHDAVLGDLEIDQVLSHEQAQEALTIIQNHGFISSWTLRGSEGGFGVRSNVFDQPKYADFIEAYRPVYEKIAAGIAYVDLERLDVNGNVIPENEREPLLQNLRDAFASSFTVEEQAMLLGDDDGQNEIYKPLFIHSTKPWLAGNSAGELIYGHNIAQPMADSVVGYIRTHAMEQRVLSEMSQYSQGADFALDWLGVENDGAVIGDSSGLSPLEIALNDYPDYQIWAEQTEGDSSVRLWLDTVMVTIPGPDGPMRNPAFDRLVSFIDDAFYQAHQPDVETGSLTAMSLIQPDVIEMPLIRMMSDPSLRRSLLEKATRDPEGELIAYQNTDGKIFFVEHNSGRAQAISQVWEVSEEGLTSTIQDENIVPLVPQDAIPLGDVHPASTDFDAVPSANDVIRFIQENQQNPQVTEHATIRIDQNSLEFTWARVWFQGGQLQYALTASLDTPENRLRLEENIQVALTRLESGDVQTWQPYHADQLDAPSEHTAIESVPVIDEEPLTSARALYRQMDIPVTIERYAHDAEVLRVAHQILTGEVDSQVGLSQLQSLFQTGRLERQQEIGTAMVFLMDHGDPAIQDLARSFLFDNLQQSVEEFWARRIPYEAQSPEYQLALQLVEVQQGTGEFQTYMQAVDFVNELPDLEIFNDMIQRYGGGEGFVSEVQSRSQARVQERQSMQELGISGESLIPTVFDIERQLRRAREGDFGTRPEIQVGTPTREYRGATVEDLEARSASLRPNYIDKLEEAITETEELGAMEPDFLSDNGMAAFVSDVQNARSLPELQRLVSFLKQRLPEDPLESLPEYTVGDAGLYGPIAVHEEFEEALMVCQDKLDQFLFSPTQGVWQLMSELAQSPARHVRGIRRDLSILQGETESTGLTWSETIQQDGRRITEFVGGVRVGFEGRLRHWMSRETPTFGESAQSIQQDLSVIQERVDARISPRALAERLMDDVEQFRDQIESLPELTDIAQVRYFHGYLGSLARARDFIEEEGGAFTNVRFQDNQRAIYEAFVDKATPIEQAEFSAWKGQLSMVREALQGTDFFASESESLAALEEIDFLRSEMEAFNKTSLMSHQELQAAEDDLRSVYRKMESIPQLGRDPLSVTQIESLRTLPEMVADLNAREIILRTYLEGDRTETDGAEAMNLSAPAILEVVQTYRMLMDELEWHSEDRLVIDIKLEALESYAEALGGERMVSQDLLSSSTLTSEGTTHTQYMLEIHAIQDFRGLLAHFRQTQSLFQARAYHGSANLVRQPGERGPFTVAEFGEVWHVYSRKLDQLKDGISQDIEGMNQTELFIWATEVGQVSEALRQPGVSPVQWAEQVAQSAVSDLEFQLQSLMSTTQGIYPTLEHFSEAIALWQADLTRIDSFTSQDQYDDFIIGLGDLERVADEFEAQGHDVQAIHQRFDALREVARQKAGDFSVENRLEGIEAQKDIQEVLDSRVDTQGAREAVNELVYPMNSTLRRIQDCVSRIEHQVINSDIDLQSPEGQLLLEEIQDEMESFDRALGVHEENIRSATPDARRGAASTFRTLVKQVVAVQLKIEFAEQHREVRHQIMDFWSSLPDSETRIDDDQYDLLRAKLGIRRFQMGSSSSLQDAVDDLYKAYSIRLRELDDEARHNLIEVSPNRYVLAEFGALHDIGSRIEYLHRPHPDYDLSITPDRYWTEGRGSAVSSRTNADDEVTRSGSLSSESRALDPDAEVTERFTSSSESDPNDIVTEQMPGASDVSENPDVKD